MQDDLMPDQIETLKDENAKLKQALLLAIPWIGEPEEGPEWATPEAKNKNRAMCEHAFDVATSVIQGHSVTLDT